MKCALLAAVTFAAIPVSASAGTYVGLGIGTGPEVNEQTERLSADSRSGKLFLGTRFGNVAVEGGIGGFGMAITDPRNGVTRSFGDVYQASAALKLSLPLGNNFEAFGRAGVHHTWMEPDNEPNQISGNGLLVGAGFEYRLNMILGQGSIFVDYQYSKATLEGTERFMGNSAFDTSYRMFTLGITVGL
jgi:hypothetical protein